MNLAPVPSQACFCNDNQQISGPDTKKVRVWQEQLMFTHGQLHVMESRVGDPQHLHFAVNKSVSRKTGNIAFEEVI